MKVSDPSGFRRSPSIAAAIVFALFVLTRWLAAPYYQVGFGYMWDGILDTCVKPWQCATRQPIAGSDSCYLSYLTSYWVDRTFGYSPRHLQIFILFTAAASMSLLFTAFRRIFDFNTAVRAMLFLLVSLAFVTHEVLPTEMPTGLWGVSLVLFVLTLEPSWRRDLSLAASCLIVLFAYASGIVTVAPLILFHFLFFRSRWPRPRLVSFGCFLGIVVLLAWWIRHAVIGLTDLTRWGVGRLEVPPLAHYLGTLKIMLIDIFAHGNSWYAGTYGKPYFNILFVFLLLVSLGTLGSLIANRFLVARYFNRAGAGWQATGRKTSVQLTEHERWLIVFFLTFCTALVIAGINATEPGVRRVYTAVLLLVPIIAFVPGLTWKQGWIPKTLTALFVIALCWEALSTGSLIRTMLPPPPAATWFVAAEKIADQVGQLEEPAIIIVDREIEPALDRVFCRLYLDPRTRAKSKEFYSVDMSGPNKVVLSKNGAVLQPAATALDQNFVLVTKNQARADQLVPGLTAVNPEASLKKTLLIP